KQALAGRSNSLDGASPRSSSRISVKDSLHSIEQILFEAVGGIGAGLGMGDVMICCARKV
ncbi:MAG: hypothetical protein WC317_07415, partial [Candidatus Omnitrophota bacterium]